jgi:hypothetical protein
MKFALDVLKPPEGRQLEDAGTKAIREVAKDVSGELRGEVRIS